MRRSLLALPLAAALAGCQTKTTPLTAPPTSAAAPQFFPPETPLVVELTEVSVAGLETAVAEQRGKVVLIDVWFLGCGPCIKKFPQVVEWHRKYAEDGLAVMSVDVFPEELGQKDQVVDFLKKQAATFPNFIIKDSDAALDAWTEKYDAVFTPAVVLFDRTGKRVNLPKKPTAEQVEVAFRTELAKK